MATLIFTISVTMGDALLSQSVTSLHGNSSAAVHLSSNALSSSSLISPMNTRSASLTLMIAARLSAELMNASLSGLSTGSNLTGGNGFSGGSFANASWHSSSVGGSRFSSSSSAFVSSSPPGDGSTATAGLAFVFTGASGSSVFSGFCRSSGFSRISGLSGFSCFSGFSTISGFTLAFGFFFVAGFFAGADLTSSHQAITSFSPASAAIFSRSFTRGSSPFSFLCASMNAFSAGSFSAAVRPSSAENIATASSISPARTVGAVTNANSNAVAVSTSLFIQWPPSPPSLARAEARRNRGRAPASPCRRPPCPSCPCRKPPPSYA